MKILVTGGCGFIGTYLVNKLKLLGHDVVISELHEGYKTAQELTSADLENVDLIYHLGAMPRVGISLKKPEVVLENNVNSTLHLLELCRLNPRIALVFASSSSVKFANTLKNPYAMSKKVGEDYIHMYRTLYGVRAAAVRFFNVYGDGESNYGVNTTLIQQCKDRMMQGLNPVVYGDGKIMRDFTHVDDVVNGLLMIGEKVIRGTLPRIDRTEPVWELGGGMPISVLDIVKTFVEKTDFKIDFTEGRVDDLQLTRSEKYFWPSYWSPKINILTHIREWKAQNLDSWKGQHLVV